MGRNRNRNRKPKPSEQVDFNPPQIQSRQSSFVSQSMDHTVLRSEIKNSNTLMSSGSSFSAQDFQQEVCKKSVNFTIKQWLLLGMSRIIPHSDKSLKISIKRNEISGPKDKVQSFCRIAQNEIKEMKMKVLKFKYEISSEQIQFEMQKQWRCQVFSCKLLKNVAQKIQQNYDAKQEMKAEIQGILNRDGITNHTRFLWVQMGAYEEAQTILKRIHKECARRISEGQTTIVEILDKLKNSEKHQSIENNSSHNSHQRPSQAQSESNSSTDYSKIIQNKVVSEVKKSNVQNKDTQKKNQEQKKKKYVSKCEDLEPKKLYPQSSMKKLTNNENSFADNDFTVFQYNNSIRSDQILTRRHEERQGYRRQGRQERNDQQFQTRRPRRQKNQDQQRRPRRGQREGQQRNQRRRRYNQSQESDEDCTLNFDDQNSRSYVPRQGNRQPRRNIIFTQEYPEQYFSKEHFKEWSKKNKTLKRTDQYILEINEKFSPNEGKTYIQVTFIGQDPKGDILYAINIYFNFQKLIKIQTEQELRHQLIKKFQCKQNWLTAQYRKIFTREKFPKFQDLRKLAKRDNTAQHMNKNKNVTHTFLITGLMTQVSEMECQINQFIKKTQNTSRKVDIELKFLKINEFMRRKEVHNLIIEAVTQQSKNLSEKYKLHKATSTLTQVFVEMQLFKVQDRDVERQKKELTERFERLVDYFQFESEKYQKFKKAFSPIFSKFMIFENSKKGLTLIAKVNQIKDQMLQANKQIQKSFTPTIKQFTVRQKSQLILCKTFINDQLKSLQFSSVTPRYEQNDVLKIVLIGPLIVVDNLFSLLEEHYETIQAKILEYNISLKQQQIEILQKDKQIQRKIQDESKITLKFKNDYKLGAVFVVEPHAQQGIKYPKKTIIFENQFNFQSLPNSSVFFFRNQKQINLIKQAFILPLKAHVKSHPRDVNPHYLEDKNKQRFFIYGFEAQPQTILNSSKETTSNKVNQIFMYMPEPLNSINDFLKKLLNKLCENKDYLNKQVKITIIYKKHTNLKKILSYNECKNTHSSKTKRSWYTLQGKTKLFYSDLGNKKIEEAYVNKVAEIQLNNQHLNLTNKTHQLRFKDKIMVHKQSGMGFPITTYPNKITFTLNGVQKTIPDSQFLKIPKSGGNFLWRGNQFTDCQLSIGFYKIDLVKLIQTNLFSKFQRVIGFDEEDLKDSQCFDLEVSYDIKAVKLCFQYAVENQNSIKKAQAFVKQHLQKKLISRVKPFDNQLTADLVQRYTKEAEQQNVSIEFSQDRNSFILKAYNEKNIDIFLKILSHLSKSSKVDISYPDQWVPQTQDIQTFVVPANTQQFNKVQTAFTAGTITQLVRIQNRIVFKKFYEEKLFLKELNEGKDIKQMLLYHGTRQTDPKLIYEDKQESFNLNYTGDHNLLGKGTYFAERPQYSVNYSHIQNQVLGIKSMFYCRVLVGDSEKCPGHNNNIRDTSFKNKAKGQRYESMTDFLSGSNVYVVYKNRRAYPLYLIKYR